MTRIRVFRAIACGKPRSRGRSPLSASATVIAKALGGVESRTDNVTATKSTLCKGQSQRKRARARARGSGLEMCEWLVPPACPPAPAVSVVAEVTCRYTCSRQSVASPAPVATPMRAAFCLNFSPQALIPVHAACSSTPITHSVSLTPQPCSHRAHIPRP